MKLKEEQKEVMKSVGKKMTDILVEDIKETDVSSAKRPLVLVVLIVAAVAVMRDPMSLLLGVLAALVVMAVRSTSMEDLQKLKNSLKKEEVKAEDAAKATAEEKKELK